jgi:hypothetical protein
MYVLSVVSKDAFSFILPAEKLRQLKIVEEDIKHLAGCETKASFS